MKSKQMEFLTVNCFMNKTVKATPVTMRRRIWNIFSHKKNLTSFHFAPENTIPSKGYGILVMFVKHFSATNTFALS